MKKILFYYPQHFNRTAQASNPFFDKMLKTCDFHGISYDLLEEPDNGTDKPRNPNAQKADLLFWTITAIRKIMSMLLRKKEFYEREHYVAKLFNILTFCKYKRDVYITVSGSMYHFFSHLNPQAKVFDMQHGVLYKHHPTFFDPKTLRLRKQFYKPNLHLLFWGEGYRDCFVRGEECYLDGRAHIIGYPATLASKNTEGATDKSANHDIVISLQLTHSGTNEELERMKTTLRDFLKQTSLLPVRILLKQHPRYNNCITIDDLLHEFPNVSITSKPFEQLLETVMLHVTWFSTTAFEYAAFGIPTFFLVGEGERQNDLLFYGEYDYPLYADMTINQVIERLTNSALYKADSNIVNKWYNRFYSPFDENEFLKLVK